MRAPQRGEHTQALLSELLGLSDTDHAAAAADGAFGA
jgi:hypothetical protein